MKKLNVVIIGGGPASMMLACSLDSNKYDITIYEKNAALGRKFLVAGKGGFNLTHSEELEQFANRYYPSEFIRPFLTHFSNNDFRKWLNEVGIETFVGTSKRIFPLKGIKPIEVLKAIENKLIENQVKIMFNHEWQGWKENSLVFRTNHSEKKIVPEIVVFALGGASWSVTGSDGQWIKYFIGKEIKIVPFAPSNCAFEVDWPNPLLNTDGLPLKNCSFSSGQKMVKGEAVLTKFGIEGSGVYPLSFEIRNQLSENSFAKITIDFKPDLSADEIRFRFGNKGVLTTKEFLRQRLNLSQHQIALIRSFTTKKEYQDEEELIKWIKFFPLKVVGLAPLEDVISTVGGISLCEIDTNLELKKMPNHFCMGEMLNWDAPTGGYLLQACFSMGKFLADKLNNCKH